MEPRDGHRRDPRQRRSRARTAPNRSNARSATKNSTVNRNARLIDRVSTAIRAGIDDEWQDGEDRSTDLRQEIRARAPRSPGAAALDRQQERHDGPEDESPAAVATATIPTTTPEPDREGAAPTRRQVEGPDGAPFELGRDQRDRRGRSPAGPAARCSRATLTRLAGKAKAGDSTTSRSAPLGEHLGIAGRLRPRDPADRRRSPAWGGVVRVLNSITNISARMTGTRPPRPAGRAGARSEPSPRPGGASRRRIVAVAAGQPQEDVLQGVAPPDQLVGKGPGGSEQAG